MKTSDKNTIWSNRTQRTTNRGRT